ncbi:MAG: hypothetical protein COZ27_00295 [Candidatus Moranbacteria bacterium CG_4_10_14_3_um_filter_41_65]|nr:MAG: hypothetical protein COX32_04715 [Candidatus Moranbacteria bacterium CG23_combo_of_CG06-09_8_20_14_all_41_28]PIW93735.1 MAG: hypothetical protein COZ86_04810 [Candidatus Moranbacteria bacterium CG_4_8_14_3_um_filter_41_13]PIX91911.1 MAG: hypothetical protein COZ27_00295 [Candidatus Moranbacteria bacterium CG_4_10_14_3_um_filter_41_65]
MKVAKLIVFFLLSLLATTVFGYSNHGYDYKVTSGCTTTILKEDAYGFYQNNCTSYVAYMLNTFGIKFMNGYLGAHWSHGKTWDDAAGNISGENIPVDNHPLPGDVAYWNTGDYGHVAWVEKVNFDSSGNAISVDITEYNITPCVFSQRTAVPVNR